MQRVPETMTTPPHTGTVVLRDEAGPLGSVEVLDFQGAGVTATVSGTYGQVTIPGGSGEGAGVDQIGVFGLDDGVPLGTGTSLDAGYGVDLTLSGTRLHAAVQTPVTGSVVLRDKTRLLGSVETLDFQGPYVSASVSGTYGTVIVADDGVDQIGMNVIDHNGVFLGTGVFLDFGLYGLDAVLVQTDIFPFVTPPISGSLVVADEGAVLGSVPILNFRGAGVTAEVSGSYADIHIPGGGDGAGAFGIMGWHDGIPVGTGSVLNAVGLALSQSGSVLLLSDEVVDGYTSEWYMRTGGGIEAIAIFPGAMTVDGGSVAFNMTNAYGDFMDGLFQGMLPYTLPDSGGGKIPSVGWLKLYDKNDPDVQWFYRLNRRPVRTVVGGEPTGSWTLLDATLLASKGEFSSGTLVAASFVPPTLAYQGLLGYEDGTIVGTGTKLDVGYGLNLSVTGQVYGGASFLLEVVPPVSGSVVLADEGTLLGSVPILNFRGAGVTAEVSGSYADIHIPGGGGDGAGILGVFALDDGVPLGTGTSIDFGDNLTASLSGTRIRVDAQAGGVSTVVTGTYRVEELFYEVELASATGSIVISPVPQTFDHIYLEMFGRGTQAAAGVDTDIVLNRDTTNADYRKQVHVALDGTHNIFPGDDNVILSVPGSTAPANVYGWATMELPFYRVTGVHQVVRGWSEERRGASSTIIVTTHLNWERLEAVDVIDIVPSAGNLDVGTRLRAYGVGHQVLVRSVS